VRIVAAESNFSGTVSDKTNAEMLYLNTSGGTMEIKIDSNVAVSGTKVILPGNSVVATCYVGSDEYWHVSKLSGSTQVGKPAIDQSTKATVKGRIAKGTSEELLYLVVDNGTMQIKIDESTDMDSCRFLIVGKTIQVVCARGSDAYMHALSIADVGGTTAYSAGSSVGTASGNSVTGTVAKGTTASILFLETSGGTMQFVLDLATDASACRSLIPGQSVTVTFYRGSDAWNHSSKLVNNTATASAEVSLDGSKSTFSGTVSSDTREDTLFLETSGGTMQIRLDASTNFSRCPVLLLDKSVQVVCQRGSDEYLHAVQIIAN
jgi:transcriptional antiterminator Rof (Rho-off)